MAQLSIRDLTFTYPGRRTPAVEAFSLDVEAGSFVVLTGPSGCGKTTLLRLLKPALSPVGRLQGTVMLDGVEVRQLDARRQAADIGFVQQQPDQQIVASQADHELAFGLESLGLDDRAIRQKVAEMASFFGIEGWLDQDTSTLSGGQQQILNVASAMVTHPRLLILDEPSSQLDPIAAAALVDMLVRLNHEMGTTVIMAEQRLAEALPQADVLAVMDQGRLLLHDEPAQAGRWLAAHRPQLFQGMPAPMRVWAAVDGCGRCPLTVAQGRRWLDGFAEHHPLAGQPAAAPLPQGRTAVALHDVWFRYGKDTPQIFSGLNLQAGYGRITAIMGGNGIGKTTLLKMIAGLVKPQQGRMEPISGRIGFLPQRPETMLAQSSVRQELQEMTADTAMLADIGAACRLTGLLDRHPYDLSSGERQRLVLAKVLLTQPEIILLDEPTKGLDAGFKPVLAGLLRQLAAKGCCVIMASHDIEFCAAHADSCALLFGGTIAAQDEARRFFATNDFYTTEASRMARQKLPYAVTAGDVITACGGQAPSDTADPPDDGGVWPAAPDPQPESRPEPVSARGSWRALALMAATMPPTIYLGWRFSTDRTVLALSLALAAEALGAFFISFEKQRPQPRQLVVLAVLCAINVAGRMVFAFLPNFKPVMALTIITGVAYGGPAGFLVGSVTMLASNALFGQGPWTIWQMLAMGWVGYLAGVLYRWHVIGTGWRGLCIYGAVAAVVIYGGIMNPASVLMYQSTVSWPMIWASCLSGLPVDLVQAAATVAFLRALSAPLLAKLQRLTDKYGLRMG